MEIKQIALHSTIFLTDQIHADSFPKIAFIGRSNVGKSSLINRLLNRKKLARTASRPGKTVSINYYRINDRCDFVDLPGFGYSRLSDGEQKRVQGLIREFFLRSENIRLVCLLIDCRRGIMETDITHIKPVLDKKIPILTILTKGDKLSLSRLKNQINNLQKTYGLIAIPFSIPSNLGRLEVWGQIDQALKE